MLLVRGLSRLALTTALLAIVALGAAATTASGQGDRPACSDGVDNDSDNATDGADAGCAGGEDGDETDSPYAGIQTITETKIETFPLPLVTLLGTVDADGVVDVSRLAIKAKRGTLVRIRCQGKDCPAKKISRTMITNSIRLKQLETELEPRMSITMRLQRPETIGKYVRYQIKRNEAPDRSDACLDQKTEKVEPCYVG